MWNPGEGQVGARSNDDVEMWPSGPGLVGHHVHPTSSCKGETSVSSPSPSPTSEILLRLSPSRETPALWAHVMITALWAYEMISLAPWRTWVVTAWVVTV